MSGKKPDFDVVVAQTYETAGGEEKTRWYKVGAAWTNAKGISFNICTMPGVSLYLFPVKEPEPEPTGRGKQAASRKDSWRQSDEDIPF